MCKKIKEIIQIYFFTVLIMIMVAAFIDPKSFGLPDGLIDSIIVVLTLLEIIMKLYSKMKGDEGLKNKLDSFVSKVFTLEASINFLFRVLVILFLLGIFYAFLFFFTGRTYVWDAGYQVFRLLIAIALVYLMVESYYKTLEIKKTNPYLIYYVYLFIIFIASVLNKFL